MLKVDVFMKGGDSKSLLYLEQLYMDNIENALTHAGKFHADDVFSAALLKIVFPKVRIVRSFRVPPTFSGLVFDIGFGPFDHHQENAEIRENGTPFAAFGLLWREYGIKALEIFGCKEEFIEKEANHFDEVFVQPLDLDDNTGCGNVMAGIINNFNPVWDSKKDANENFFEAVIFAGAIIEKKLESMMAIQRARAMVEKALAEAKDHIVILPRYAPWKHALTNTTAEFVVYPSQRGGFSAQALQEDGLSRNLKIPFPKEWAGKQKNELPDISGIPTLFFCHNGSFLVSASSIQDAVQACRIAKESSIPADENCGGNTCS